MLTSFPERQRSRITFRGFNYRETHFYNAALWSRNDIYIKRWKNALEIEKIAIY